MGLRRQDVAQVYRAPDGYRWRIVAGNGETIAAGEAYANKGDATAMLEQHFPHATLVDLDAFNQEEDDTA